MRRRPPAQPCRAHVRQVRSHLRAASSHAAGQCSSHALPGLQAGARFEVGLRGSAEEREERTFKMWASSLGLDLPISDLREDCRSGLVLLRVEDHLQPGLVDWTKVQMKPKSIFERIGNCNQAQNCGTIPNELIKALNSQYGANGQYKLSSKTKNNKI